MECKDFWERHPYWGDGSIRGVCSCGCHVEMRPWENRVKCYQCKTTHKRGTGYPRNYFYDGDCDEE